MPNAPISNGGGSAQPMKRKIDWRAYGARPADDGDRPTGRANAEGDTISGTLARAAEVNTRFGAKIVLELDGARKVVAGGESAPDGDYAVWPTPGLLNALDECEADQGDFVVVTLTELIDTGKGNPFKRFSVEVTEDAF